VAGDDASTRTLVLRLWLPDRPGALGLVASRIGAVRGDVLAIDILERGGGQVVDELVVSLPAGTPDELLIAEVGAVDDVAVESVREAPSDRPDPALALFELGAEVAEACAGRTADPIEVLGRGIGSALEADWVVVIGPDGEQFRHGSPPESRWLSAFFDGSRHLPSGSNHGPADVLWARLPRSSMLIAAGRSSRAAHERERVRLQILARTVDHLLAAVA
jgi:hypothetical protein